MGLDITAYSKVVPTEPHERGDDCWEREPYHVAAWAYPGLERSLRGIPDATSDYDTAPHYASVGEEMNFGAGSYSGYGAWRESLANAMGFDINEFWQNREAHYDDPFYELLHFADNEGVIGPEAAADLAVDFRDWRNKVYASTEFTENPWFRDAYENWANAFEMASPDGLVQFH